MLVPTLIISLLAFLVGYRIGRRHKKVFDDRFVEDLVGDKSAWMNNYKTLIEYKKL